MAKSSGISSNGEMAYENASKRPHQWLLGPEVDLLPRKRHMPDIPTSNLFTGVVNPNVPAWGNTFCFQSTPGQFTERLFDVETTREAGIHDESVHSKAILGRSGIEEPYGDHSFGLSMCHTLEDPQSAVSNGGIRKVKVSQVKDYDGLVSSTNAQNFDRTDNRSMPATNVHRVDQNSMCLGLAFGKEDESTIRQNYERENGVFVSIGQPYSKGDENISLVPYDDDNNFTSDLAFNKVDSHLTSMGQTYHHADVSAASKGRIFHKESILVCRDGVYNRKSNALTDSCNKGQSTIISFGGLSDDDANNSGRILSNYEFVMTQSAAPHISETPISKDVVGSRINGLGNDATFCNIGVSAKKQETKVPKKVKSNTFPSNVRSLLSTGMLDGVPVKYVTWSREKELLGVIKGSGYLCGCGSCNSSKVVNAYEFERHAGCKTKHPNNHIYFENGKTIYGIVQELRNTPQDMLFGVIPTVTGSSINQKSFRLWKESYLAATRELQRIYGKDEGKFL